MLKKFYFCYLFFCLFFINASAAILSGDTSESKHSLFIPGQQPILYFFIKELPPDNQNALLLKIENELEEQLSSFHIPIKEAKEEHWQVFYKGDNSWQIDVLPQHRKLGFYKVNAKLSSGELLAERASRPAGYLTYAIIPDPTLRKDYPAEESFFGMLGPFEPALMGHSWQVHNYNMYSWISFEPDNPEQFEQKVKELEAEEERGGWAIMPNFESKNYFSIGGKAGNRNSFNVYPMGRPPYWAAKNETRAHNNAALTKEGETAFHNFCTKLGKYMAEKKAAQKIHYYLPTVEPQIPWGYKGTNEDLLRVQEIAYKALHAADPNAVVGGPGFGLDAVEQLEDLLKLGLANYIDVLDFHPYMGGDVLPAEFGLVKRIRDIRELVQKYAGRQLPIAGTEAGYNVTGENKINWLRGAWSDVQHNLILLGEGFWFNVCFHGADNSREPHQNTWGHFFNLDTERDYGIQKGSPKPVVPAFAAMSWLLEGHKSAGAVEWFGEGINAYVYERPDSLVMAIWSNSAQKAQIPVRVTEVQHFDWMGNESKIACPDGILTLELNNAPHYIKGLKPEHWGKNGSEKLLSIQESQRNYIPGQTIKLSCDIKAASNENLQGFLHFKGNPALGLSETKQEFSCPAGKNTKVNFTWLINEDVALGEHSLAFVLLNQNGQALAGAGSTIIIEPALNIIEIKPAISENKYGVNIALKAAQQQKFTGNLSAKLFDNEASLQNKKLKLPTGAQAVNNFFWEAPHKAPWCMQVNVKANKSSSAYEVFSVNREFNFCSAVKMPDFPIIDGDLAEWQHIEPINLSAENIIEGKETWQGNKDLSANIRFAWNEQALFIACEVFDENHYQQAIKMPFFTWDDSLQVAINLDPQNAHLSGGDSIEGGILKRWHEFIFAKHSTQHNLISTRISSYDLRFAETGPLNNQQLPLAIKRYKDKTVYEMALSWKLLGQNEKPQANSAIGITMLIKDVDLKNEQRITKAIQLFSGLHKERAIEKYGWIVLRE